MAARADESVVVGRRIMVHSVTRPSSVTMGWDDTGVAASAWTWWTWWCIVARPPLLIRITHLYIHIWKRIVNVKK